MSLGIVCPLSGRDLKISPLRSGRDINRNAVSLERDILSAVNGGIFSLNQDSENS